MKTSKIIINTKNKSYPVYVGNNIFNLTNQLIKKKLNKVKKIFIISDHNIPSFFLKKISQALKNYDCTIHKLVVSEKIKNFKVANKLAEEIIKNNFNRTDCIISLGGGVLGDLVAFVASITKRGIKFINIPTTLLAQVDASIGGKTGINSLQGKNLIGTFYQPEFVLIDLTMLKSLPYREMICGYGEILKHALIADRKFFLWLCQNAKKNNI